GRGRGSYKIDRRQDAQKKKNQGRLCSAKGGGGAGRTTRRRTHPACIGLPQCPRTTVAPANVSNWHSLPVPALHFQGCLSLIGPAVVRTDEPTEMAKDNPNSDSQ